MIYKNDLLNKNLINIISYNYEESNGFSQETAVESHRGEYKTHKFVITVENQYYEILFKNKHVTSNYSAMEDVFINTTDTITDKDLLIIKKIDVKDKHDFEKLLSNFKDRYDFEPLLSIENNRLNNNNQIDNQIQNFINKLIESANSLGVGVYYREHYNKEDDFCNTYPNMNHTGVSTVSDNVLFINDNEIDYFNQYLLITDQDESLTFIENLEKKIKEESLNLEKKIKEEALIVSNKKLTIIQQYTNYENKIEQLLNHINTQPKSIGFTIEEITFEIKQTEDEIKLLKEKISLYDKIDEPYDEEYIILEKYNKIEALTTLIQHIPEQQKIEEKLLKEFNSDITLIRTLIEYNHEGYLSHYLDHQEQYFEEQQQEQQQDELIFNSEEEWDDYQYTKPRSLKERFELIKICINNQVSYDIIPLELKKVFGIQDKSVIDFLNDKIQGSNDSEIVKADVNTTKKYKISRK